MAEPVRDSQMVMTVDTFLDADLPDGKSELVGGELRVTPPPGAPHGRAATNLVVLLTNYARQHRPGDVFSDTLEGGSVIPGFACPVTDVFDGIAR